LKNLTGLDQEVHDYVMQFPESTAFLQKLMDLLDFTIPLYAKEGKSELVLAFGCTGGKHRSVTFAQEVYQHLASTKNSATVTHRDIQK
ncbi:MAG: RNase adaptor protein RapZ, partial [Clostridia bacterium]|nr:RNase adaptor protein RapZ [Clostridia bacterium]